MSPKINSQSVRLWRTILVKKGSQLSFGPCKYGCRAYLSVAGGFDIPTIMNSKSTYLRAEIGGFNGRALQVGDQIASSTIPYLSRQIMDTLANKIGENSFIESEWSVSSDLIPYYKNPSSIRVMRGRQFELFSKESQNQFFSVSYEVTPQSDRMGYRLKGHTLALETPSELISEAVVYGSIQVPADGNPIVLMADRQTTGGYPKIAQIATVDLPKMAQLKPGDHVRFSEISHNDSQHLLLERERNLQKLKNGILLKLQ